MPRTARSAKENTEYINKGVIINPSTPSVGENVKIVYDGLLSKSGATHVYARYGFGNRWNNLHEVPMAKTNSGFEATIPVLKPDTLNIAFKDCANHWDNNAGLNYSFDVV